MRDIAALISKIDRITLVAVLIAVGICGILEG